VAITRIRTDSATSLKKKSKNSPPAAAARKSLLPHGVAHAPLVQIR
jgi:hypothetical protein